MAKLNLKALAFLVIGLAGLYAWNDPNIMFRISTFGQKLPVTSEVTVKISKSRMLIIRSINGKMVKETPFFVVGKEGDLDNIPEGKYPMLASNFGKTPPGLMEVKTHIIGIILPPGEKGKIRITPDKINQALKDKKPRTIIITVTAIPGKEVGKEKSPEPLPNHYIRSQLKEAQKSSDLILWQVIYSEPEITKDVSTIEIEN